MDQVDNLILQVKGQEELRALNAQLSQEKNALAELAQQLRAGEITQRQFESAARTSAAAVLGLEAEVKKLGGSGIGGGGLLQASYAVQDFTSVLAGGQGLARALASVQNNIPGLLMSLGVGQGLAGVFSLLSMGVGALIPVVESFWGKLDDHAAADSAKRRLQEIKEAAEDAHKAFSKLRDAPTDAEQLSAEGIGNFLRERPNATRARAAVADAVSDSEALGALPDGERAALGADITAAGRSDKDLRAEARGRAGRQHAQAGGEGQAPEESVEAEYRELAKAREAARGRREALMHQARGRRADQIISGAQVAGPAGAAARNELLRRTLGVEGLEELQGYDPDRLERDEREYQETDERLQEAEESGRKTARGQRKRRAAVKRHEEFKTGLQHRQTDAALQAHTDEIKEQEKADAEDAREDDRAGAAWHRGRPARKVAAVRQQVAGAAKQFTQANGLSPATAPQIDDMATQVIAMTREGISTNDAILAALRGKAQEMQRMQQEFMRQRMEAMRLQMGGDNSGQFSQMPGAY